MIIDYGVGNVSSVATMVERTGAQVSIARTPAEVAAAPRLVLPGVGSFDAAVQALHDSALLPSLRERVLQDRVPLLGICVGMQMLCRGSEEGSLPGLGWIDAQVCRFPADAGVPVPHMGWSAVTVRRRSTLFPRPGDSPEFYFLHSYRLRDHDDGIVTASADYAGPFACAVQQGNVLGVQFHPEKSHSAGRRLFAAFADAA